MFNSVYRCTTFCAAICLALSVRAQDYFYNDRFYDAPVLFEIGVSSGLMNCLTDLGGRPGIGGNGIKDINWKAYRPFIGAFAGMEIENIFSIRLQVTLGNISAADSVLKGDRSVAAYRYDRNLSFRSAINELSLHVDFRVLQLLPAFRERSPIFSPFVTAGIGRFHFNPQAELSGTWYNLQPLRTEGQGFPQYADRTPYRLTQTCFPVGMGLQYEPGARFRIRAECIYRLLRTDYLDDVSTTYTEPESFARNLPPGLAGIASQLADRRNILPLGRTATAGAQRGNPGKRDSYFTAGLRICLVMGRKPRW